MVTETRTTYIPGPINMTFRDTPTSTIVKSSTQVCQRYHYHTRTYPTRRPKPRTGWIVPTAYSIEVVSALYPNGLYTTRDVVYYDQRSGTGYLGPAVPGITSGYYHVPDFKASSDHGPRYWKVPGADLRERAERQAYAKLKMQRVNLGVMAGEARKTAAHLSKTVYDLGSAALAVRRGQFRKAMRHLGCDKPRKAPGKWLEWRYGWMPLYMDIHGSAQALADSSANNTGWQSTVKGIVREPWEKSGTNGTGANAVFFEESGMTGAFVRFDVKPDNNFLAALSSLGLTNPLEIAWELLPLSFVIDWLVPVGDWLSTLDASYGYDFRSGSCTVRGEGRGTGRHEPGDSDPVKCISPSYAGRSSYRKLTLNRTVYSGFPAVQYPRLRLGLNLNRFADGMALLSQAFR